MTEFSIGLVFGSLGGLFSGCGLAFLLHKLGRRNDPFG